VPVEVPWLENVAALLQAWYAGQESGNSILDVLLGEVSPSGKLPISWPKKNEHTGCYGNFGLDSYDSREVEYVEGVFVGYRHFDRQHGTEKQAQFPFGYGLTYTSFELSGASLSGSMTSGSSIDVSITVRNNGAVAGSETVQVYVAPPMTSGIERPLKALAGFEKLFLQPGESKLVHITFGPDVAAYWDERSKEAGGQCWQVESGKRTVLVGTSSCPKDLTTELSLEASDAFSFGP
jgi:beta-glucosidase